MTARLPARAAADAERRHGRPSGRDAIAGRHRGVVALHPTLAARAGLAAALAEAGDPAARAG